MYVCMYAISDNCLLGWCGAFQWKPVGDAATYDNEQGIRLVTATNRRNPPQCVDSKIHHCNLINNSK